MAANICGVFQHVDKIASILSMLLCFWLLLHRHYVNQIIDSESSMQKQIRVKRQIMPRVKILSRPSVEKNTF